MVNTIPNPEPYLIYNLPESRGSVEAIIDEETIWVTQKSMAQLFDTTPQNITQHLKNIFQEGELQEDRTCKNFLQVQREGSRHVRRNALFYNLDAVISVGYRVNSRRATLFRKWATDKLKEYIKKGFVLDDDRLKSGVSAFGKDYFRELLERVRSIRASERRIWQQITDIFAECSIDYDRNSQTTHDFYAMVQNKFHFAITGQTAAEIIFTKADHQQRNMGLMTWKHAPDGRILKSDVLVAKNYLTAKEIRQLERTVTGFFDYIEDLIERGNAFTMKEFSACVDAFLHFRRYQILTDKGRISRQQAKNKAISEYQLFDPTQEIVSDFDKEMRRLKAQNNEVLGDDV